MLTWQQFAAAQPKLAETGQRPLYQYGIGLGFLATVRKDGGPRLHPVCPILHTGHLYLFVVGSSPKCYDLDRDGRHALHAFLAEHDDEEFSCKGKARPVSDQAIRTVIAGIAKHAVQADEVLFELFIEHVLHTAWENPRQPHMRPIHTTWHAAAE